MIRPGWDEWALGIAKAVSTRGDCTRRQVGAVILDAEHGPVSFGYNGTRPGAEGCLAGDCPRGRHYERKGETGWGWCACGNAWPCPDAVAPGSSYDTGPGACTGVHAEINAIFFADKRLLKDATIYITDAPCDGCKKLLRNTPIRRVVWPEGEYVH
jgi:dCMP deaminase